MPISVAPEAPLHAVCYDLSCARERRRVDKLLKGYGSRAQKSVFECHLTPSQRKAMQVALEMLALKTGHVLVYRVYAEAHPLVIGEGRPTISDPVYSYVI